MIKKMMLLAVSAMALAAFVVPAAAQANPMWSGNGAFSGSGGLTSNTPGLTTGPASVTFSGTVVAGVGTITAMNITSSPIKTSLSAFGCDATSGTTSTAGGGEGRSEVWPITLATHTGGVNAVTIDNITFTNHYNATCVGIGVPSTVSATGSVTGTVSGNCIKFAAAGDDNMFVEVGGAHTATKVDVSGEACITAGPTIT